MIHAAGAATKQKVNNMQNVQQRIKNENALTQTLSNNAFAIFFLEGNSRVAIKLHGISNVSLAEHDGTRTDGKGNTLVGWYEISGMVTWATFNAVFQGFDDKLTY